MCNITCLHRHLSTNTLAKFILADCAKPTALPDFCLIPDASHELGNYINNMALTSIKSADKLSGYDWRSYIRRHAHTWQSFSNSHWLFLGECRELYTDDLPALLPVFTDSVTAMRQCILIGIFLYYSSGFNISYTMRTCHQTVRGKSVDFYLESKRELFSSLNYNWTCLCLYGVC